MKKQEKHCEKEPNIYKKEERERERRKYREIEQEKRRQNAMGAAVDKEL